jgi:hypothetical protein
MNAAIHVNSSMVCFWVVCSVGMEPGLERGVRETECDIGGALVSRAKEKIIMEKGGCFLPSRTNGTCLFFWRYSPKSSQ